MKKCAKANICAIAAFAVLMVSAAGCMKDASSNAGGGTSDNPVFDFAPRILTTLDVRYDVPEGYEVYFEVYTENPQELDADGQIVKKAIEPIDAGYTDGKGVYTHQLSVPASVDEVFVYSPYVGVPRVMTAKVLKDGLATAQLPAVNAMSAPYAGTRASDDYKNAEYNKISGANLKRLGYWINDASGYLWNGVNYVLYGRPDYVRTDKITVSADILNLINNTLPEGGGVDPALIKNGDIHVTERAHVYLHLIDDQTSANSTLAYYCYDTQNPPKYTTDISDIIIALPNSKVLKYNDYSPAGYTGAMERGEGVTLHYWKDGEDMGDEFPAGTSIGWVIYNQSYESGVSGQALNAAQTCFYASKELNSDARSHVALFRSGEKVLFGFEDWIGDYDYNDVCFYVKSDPIEAITPEIPEVNPEEPTDDTVASTVIYRGILCFEDCWPYRADFDLNDVVMQYESTVSYNKKNEVLQTDDKYTVLHSGASINNSFAYQLDAQRGEVSVSVTSTLGGDGGAYVDPKLDRATIRLANKVLSYANNPVKTVFNVVTKYTGRRLSKDDFTKPPYNPFITTNNDDSEVHLTNMRPTEALNKKLLGYGDDHSNPNRNLYYITYDEHNVQMPFAIDIAYTTNGEMAKFVIPAERMRIDQYYPGFLNWVKTNGQQDREWYLHPAIVK